MISGTLMLVASASMLAATLAVSAERSPPKPNIIVFFSDDHGYSDLSSQDVFDDIRTPNIDALAAGGVRMTDGYVTAPQCVPSRAGLLAGRYQTRFGVESNGRPLDGFNVQETIAERLKKAGYVTGMAGKWHLGPGPKITDHGFDKVFYKNSTRPGMANFNLEGKDVPMGPEKTGLYHLDACSAAACAFIDRFKDQPFFFYLAYRAPHVPLDAPEKYLKRFPGEMPERRRQCLAMMSSVDDGVGRIMAALRRHGIEENTLIFFIGDNGAPLKIHKEDKPGGGPGWDGSLNDPLNGEKGMLAEGGIRVPYVVHWKGTIPAAQVYRHPVTSLDVAATANALAGLPGDSQLDGVNLIPYLRGEKPGLPHETLYWRWVAQSAIREGKWKYLRGGEREYLYDLSVDKEEKHSLLGAHPDIAARLKAKLEAWSTELEPPGLATKSMATTWQSYFDFYLDGKPAPLHGGTAEVAEPGEGAPAASLQGWVARNGVAAVRNGSLYVTPAKSAEQRPFIARAQLDIPGPSTGIVRVRCQRGGEAGFGWRLNGQRSFPREQTVTFDVPASGDWQEIKLDIPAKGRIIHIRLLLPAAECEIRGIELGGVHGKPATFLWGTAQ